MDGNFRPNEEGASGQQVVFEARLKDEITRLVNELPMYLPSCFALGSSIVWHENNKRSR